MDRISAIMANTSIIVKIMDLLKVQSLPDPFTVKDVLDLIGANRSLANEARMALRKLQAEGSICKLVEFRPGAYGRQVEQWTKHPAREPWMTIESLIESQLEYLPRYFTMKDVQRLVGASKYYRTDVVKAVKHLHARRVFVLIDSRNSNKVKGRPHIMWSADPIIVAQERSFEQRLKS